MKYLFLLLITSFISFNAAASKFVYFNYRVNPNEDFADILTLFVKNDSVMTRNSPTVIKILANNKSVFNWEKLDPGQELAMYIEDKEFDFVKFSKFYNSTINELSAKEKKGKDSDVVKRFQAFTFETYGADKKNIKRINN